jgi:hypothetical protein
MDPDYEFSRVDTDSELALETPQELTRAMRSEIVDMSEREMLAEMLAIIRNIGDVAEQLQPKVGPLLTSLENNPMIKTMMRMI